MVVIYNLGVVYFYCIIIYIFLFFFFFFFFQAEDGIRDGRVTGVQTCALPISNIKILQRLNSDLISAGLTSGRAVARAFRPYLALPCSALPGLTSPCQTKPCPALPRLTWPYPASPRLAL